MSLRKPPTLTAARLAANRRNAQRSTGPRTARGKARSRLNGLRHGERSKIESKVMEAILEAPPGRIEEAVAAYISPLEARHPVLDRFLTQFWSEPDVTLFGRARPSGRFENDERSLNAVQNQHDFSRSHDLYDSDGLILMIPRSR